MSSVQLLGLKLPVLRKARNIEIWVEPGPSLSADPTNQFG